ncbi:asparagine synthetase [glutamine-hydrolyzing] 1 [Filimonas sp.]|nr:asparagine synthetase [glutamine-hydrolyzing] 1 [Filimonas sp.]
MDMSITKYYDIDWKHIDHSINIDKAKQQFEELFYTSVKRRLRSDVAVGSSLSGGLDSSLVVCVIDELRKGTGQKQNTFSAVFPGYKKDERRFMDIVLTKTDACPHFVTPDDQGLIQDLEKLSWHQEEPYVSASIYAQYCVMRLAKENNTTVLLDGQGADEIMAGYHHYYLPFFKGIKKDTGYARQLMRYNELHQANPINGITKKSMGDIVRSLSPSLIRPAKKLRNLYIQSTSPILNKDFFHQYKHEVFDTPGNSFDSLNESLYNSTLKYGLQQLLRYADRNSMAHSREVRLPFLYHEMVEFLFRLPETYKINEGWTKWIMRETFSILPPEIRWRVDKIGYEPPQKTWMENEAVKQQIRESKEKLVKANYLHSRQSDKNVVAVDAAEMTDSSWQQFMAGSLLNS